MGTPEYVGVVLLVAVLVGAVVLLNLPQRVAEWGSYAVCSLFDEDCERPGDGPTTLATREDTSPPACTVSSSVHDSRSTTDWIFDRSVEGDRFVMSELSDGSVVIIDTQYEGSGTVVGGGIDIPISARDTLGVSATGSGVEIEETGRMFVLDGQSLDDYQDTMADIATMLYKNQGRLIEMQLPFNNETVDEYLTEREAFDLLERALDNMIEEHVTHDYHRTTGEVSLSVGASKGVASGGVTIDGSTGTVTAVDRETGDYTITVELDGSVARSVAVGALGLGASAADQLSAGSSISLDYTSDGELVGTTLTTSADVEAGGFVGLDLTSMGDTPGGTDADLGVGLAEGGRVEASFTLPVEDGQLPGGGDLATLLSDPAANVGELADLAGRHGEALVQGYQVSETSEQVDLAVRLLASAGISDSDSHRQLSLVDAVSYDPHNGLMHRRDCTR